MGNKAYSRKESAYNPKTVIPTIEELLQSKSEVCPHCDAGSYYVEVEDGGELLQQRIFFFCLICGYREFPFPGIEAKGKSEPNRRND